MEIPDNFLKAGSFNVCINLGGGNIRMTQHCLNGPQVRPVSQHMGGEGMAQSMGGDCGAYSGFKGISFDNFPKPIPGHGLAVSCDE
jgi:hypothetical protein